jgi:hypothetical protein
MAAVGASETLVNSYQSTWHYIPEDGTFQVSSKYTNNFSEELGNHKLDLCSIYASTKYLLSDVPKRKFLSV